MRSISRELKQFIHETLYRARAPDGRETQVDAPNTMKAGNLAANKFGGGIDPFTIDLQPVEKYGDDVGDIDAATGRPRKARDEHIALFHSRGKKGHRQHFYAPTAHGLRKFIIKKHGDWWRSIEHTNEWLDKNNITHIEDEHGVYPRDEFMKRLHDEGMPMGDEDV